MYFVIAGVFVVIALICLISPFFTGAKITAASAVIPLAILGIITAFMSATTVDARAVGIQTSFGRYQDTLSNGLHWTAPWSSVEQFSTQIQPLNLDVPVSFDGGGSGTANVTVRWSIDADGAEELWKDWKTFDRVRDNLVTSEAREQVGAVFSEYTPVDAIDGGNRANMQGDVVSLLTSRLGDRGIDVDSVSITGVKLGDRAQNSLDRIVEATANTQRATEEQARAVIEAETARIRQQSQTPEALQRYCLEVVNAWDVSKNGPLPATFDCDFSDEQTPVIVGAN